MLWRTVIAASCALWVNAQANLRGGRPAPKHVVLIVTDDQGYSDIGYEDSTFYTPTLDRLANEGIKLRNFHTSSSCTPTRATIMTGLYPNRLGLQDGALIPGENRFLDASFTTLPQVLATAGYRNYAVGKWHLGQVRQEHLPLQRGFEKFFGTLNGAAGYFTRRIGMGCDNQNPVAPDGLPPSYGSNCFFWNAVDIMEGNAPASTYNPALGGSASYMTDAYATKAVQYIGEHNANEPMFLYLAPTAPHAPLDVAQPYMALCANVSTTPYQIRSDFRKRICSMMASVDNMVAQVIAKLTEKGMIDSTLFLYTSDNGGVTLYGSLNGAFRGQKGEAYDGGVRAVSFVAGEPVKAAAAEFGHERTDFVQATDFFATIAQYAGVDLTSEVDSKPFWQQLIHGAPFTRQVVYLDFATSVFANAGGLKFMHKGVTYKYLINPSAQAQFAGYVSSPATGTFLFDLDANPQEDGAQNLIPAWLDPDVDYALQFRTVDQAAAYTRALELTQEILNSSIPSGVTIPVKFVVGPTRLGCWLPVDSPYVSTTFCGVVVRALPGTSLL